MTQPGLLVTMGCLNADPHLPQGTCQAKGNTLWATGETTTSSTTTLRSVLDSSETLLLLNTHKYSTYQKLTAKPHALSEAHGASTERCFVRYGIKTQVVTASSDKPHLVLWIQPPPVQTLNHTRALTSAKRFLKASILKVGSVAGSL